MPPDRVTRKEMNEITRRLDEQDDMLREILVSIKGNKSMGIQGMVTAQEQCMDEIKGIKMELDALNAWKESITTYITLVTSKRLWKSLFYAMLGIGILYLASKYGIEYAWETTKRWLKL